MAPYLTAHWVTPCVMVFSFLFGIAFALSHHFFYASLENKPTATSDYTLYGTHYPGQQVNIAVGTAFAFLARSAFVLAISTAFYQVFWKKMKHDSRHRKPPSLQKVDVVYSGPTNLVSLFNFSVWLQYPLLFLMVLSMWLIPIASIIAPATLSVQLREKIPNTSMQNVPRIDFSNLNFVAGMPSKVKGLNTSSYYIYDGPSQSIQQIAIGVAAQHDILPIVPPFPNASWALDFSGPSLKCEPVDTSRSVKFKKNIAEYVNQDSTDKGYCYKAPTYLAWFQRLDITTEQVIPYTEPYKHDSKNSSAQFFWDDPAAIFSVGVDESLDPIFIKVEQPIDVDPSSYTFLSQNSTMYVSVMPNMVNMVGSEDLAKSSSGYAFKVPAACQDLKGTPKKPLGMLDSDITMLQCRLYNSTYRTNFTYVNGAQTVIVNVNQNEAAVPIINFVRGPNIQSELNDTGCTTLYAENLEDKTCHFDTTLLPQLSYQGVLQAFSALITGDIALETSTSGLSESTRIRSTSLMNTKELTYLTDYEVHARSSETGTGNIAYPDLQWALSLSKMRNVSGIDRLMQGSEDSRPSLQEQLETMFQNFTISLMGSTLLQPNYSSPDAPPRVLVTEYTAQTIYVYSAKKLWAAYGAAAACTLMSVIIGMFAIIVSNRASYSNAFSTLLRIARAAELSEEVRSKDTGGESPLPEYLAKAIIWLASDNKMEIEESDTGRKKDNSATTSLLTT